AGEHVASVDVGEEPADFQVLGSEIVPPFADAVRLVDRDERAAEIAHETSKSRKAEPFRRDIEEAQLAGRGASHAPPHLATVKDRGEEVARTPRLSRAWTWSAINETSGEITSVVPWSNVAGS